MSNSIKRDHWMNGSHWPRGSMLALCRAVQVCPIPRVCKTNKKSVPIEARMEDKASFSLTISRETKSKSISISKNCPSLQLDLLYF